MKKRDAALQFTNPRILAAVYFGLFSVVGTILTNALLSILGVEQMVRLFAAIIWGMVIASCTGAIMGKQIILCPKPYTLKVFLIGFFMVLVSLPVFDLGILVMMEEFPTTLFDFAKAHDFVYVFAVMLVYSYILFGFILAVAAGFAAIYLRGYLVYDILDTYEYENETKSIADHGKPVKAKARTNK